MNRLFLRKLAVAFLVGFLPVVAQVATGLGPAGHFTGWHALAATLAAGAVSAAVRALFVAVPGITLEPSDAQPIISRPPVEQQATIVQSASSDPAAPRAPPS